MFNVSCNICNCRANFQAANHSQVENHSHLG